MAIKDLRKLDEAKATLAAALKLVEEAGMTVVEGDIEVPLDEAIALVKGAGHMVVGKTLDESAITSLIEMLKEKGYTVLSEEMMDKVDEELEAIVAKRVSESKKSKKSEEDEEDDEEGEEDDEEGDEKDADEKKEGCDDKDGEGDEEGDDEKDADEKKSIKKESFLNSLMGDNIIEGDNTRSTARKGSLLESLMA